MLRGGGVSSSLCSREQKCCDLGRGRGVRKGAGEGRRTEDNKRIQGKWEGRRGGEMQTSKKQTRRKAVWGKSGCCRQEMHEGGRVVWFDLVCISFGDWCGLCFFFFLFCWDSDTFVLCVWRECQCRELTIFVLYVNRMQQKNKTSPLQMILLWHFGACVRACVRACSLPPPPSSSARASSFQPFVGASIISVSFCVCSFFLSVIIIPLLLV